MDSPNVYHLSGKDLLMVFATTALEDKVVIVTGGGTGLGRGMVSEMAKLGARMRI